MQDKKEIAVEVIQLRALHPTLRVFQSEFVETKLFTEALDIVDARAAQIDPVNVADLCVAPVLVVAGGRLSIGRPPQQSTRAQRSWNPD